MSERLLLALVLFGLFGGCSNLAPAHPADRVVTEIHPFGVTALSYSPDGRYMATLGRHTDSALRLYTTTDYAVVDRLQAHELCGSALRFSPDGRTLVSASDDESVRFYRIDPARYSSNGATPSAH